MRSRALAPFFGLALAALVAVAACGDGKEEPPGETATRAPTVEGQTPAPVEPSPTAAESPEGLIDPCTLLTQAEAEEAMDEPVTAVTDGGPIYCDYDADSGTFLRVETRIDDSDFQPGAEMDGVPGDAVPGIGDEALWFEGNTGVLSVRKGDIYLRIQVGVLGDGMEREFAIASAVAPRVVERLP